MFVDQLTQFARRAADQRIAAIAERVAAPLRVRVRGRRGVGCSTVARALGRWFTVVESGADLDVQVIAEVVKPEDSASGAVLAVLNKADLTGFGGDGPMAAASARCPEFSALLGVPVLPMSGLLALAALDDPGAARWAALRALAADPAPAAIPRELLAGVDLFGIALAVAALRQGSGPKQVRALWRRVSGVDEVVGRLVAAGAPARYRRILDAVTELEALAVGDPAVDAFLNAGDTVIARMGAALEAAQACGLPPGPAAPLRRAQYWQRYTRSAPGGVHRACGVDIARGALRLWAAGQEPQ
ncbi:MAG: hypothetical protein EKK34_14915 [Mycobacterium sp.]|nr:MAG: hypothetical protein EKK34_14915 [Mycobacterium sp.]